VDILLSQSKYLKQKSYGKDHRKIRKYFIKNYKKNIVYKSSNISPFAEGVSVHIILYYI